MKVKILFENSPVEDKLDTPVPSQKEAFLSQFYLGKSGKLLRVAIKKEVYADADIKEALAYLKKQNIFKHLLDKIKEELKKEDLNYSLLLVLKQKVGRELENYFR